MHTPTETRIGLPQGEVLITDGPFRLIQTSEISTRFELIDHPNWGILEVGLGYLYEKYGWTREQLQKSRGNMQYFFHQIKGVNKSYEALTCWSRGRYTRLEPTPILAEILKNEAKGSQISRS